MEEDKIHKIDGGERERWRPGDGLHLIQDSYMVDY